MTSFCTAKRHKEEKNLIQVSQKSLRSEKRLPHDVASANLSRGMDKLLNLQSAASIRRTASLPPLPGSNPASPFISVNQLPVCDSGPSAIQLEPGLGRGRDKSEVEKLKDDRIMAEREFALYLSAGLVKVTDGTSLVRFWDVSEYFHVNLCDFQICDCI
jgi:hypothetical protein